MPQQNIASPLATVGRNDPCPCGSNKKFKKCCMEKQASVAAAPAADVSSIILSGIELYKQGRFTQAISRYDEATALNPRVALAYLNRASSYAMTGEYEKMMDDMNRAKELDPANPHVHFDIGTVLSNCKDFFQAIMALQKAIELRPDLEKAWLLMADCYHRIGNSEGANAIYAEIEKKFPGNATARMEQAYILPPIPASWEEIDAVRARMMQNLDRLMAENFRFTSPENEVRYLPFYQAYHGRNNKEMAQKLAQFFYKSCPSLNYTAPHVHLPPVPGKKIRLGLMWDFLLKNLAQFWQELIEGLAKSEDFETVLIISHAAPDDPALLKFTAAAGRYIIIPKDLAESRRMIAAEQLDILVYMEIGMVMQSYFLAMARLARIQCVNSGHPVTTGLPTIDYTMTSRKYEPPNAEEHYTEKPLYFESELSIFKRPALPEKILSRKELGLPEDVHIYCCPVMLFKLHPDMDNIFARILERDPKGYILLFNSSYRTLWPQRLHKRFTAHMTPEQVARIVFIPNAPKEQFLQILCNVDAILDSVHFSFGTTALLTIGINQPFVTWPGEFFRGRVSYGIYTSMGITDLIAGTHEEYIELALRLANDKAFRAEMAEKIRRHSDAIFSNYSMIDEFTALMKDLYANHVPAPAR